ncbi:MAG: tRNA (cytidine(34)-2'-O)-methyltransferase [Pseudomonadota bacterium]
MVALALFQPEIPSNTGALMRLSACLDIPLHIIGPTGFVMTDRALRRAGLDYRDNAQTHLYPDFDAFSSAMAWDHPRLVLMTTQSHVPYHDHRFEAGDVIVMGRESSGAPEWLHQRADVRLCVPMAPNQRSLNLSIAASIVIGEALRQTNAFPGHL